MQYQDEGLVVLTALGEDEDGNPPEADDLTLWTEEFGITHPVVADPRFEAMLDLGARGGVPFMALVDEGVVLEFTGDHVTNRMIEAALAD